MTSTLLTPVRSTQPKNKNSSHSYYSEILDKIKTHGLLKKTPKFYINRFIIISILSILAWGGLFTVFSLTPIWVGILVSTALAVVLGVLSAQYGFIAHEAAHHQVFQKNKHNEWAGRILANLFAGLSYGFWIRKHNRHHNKPNQINYDPDINIRVLSFTTDSLNKKKGFEKLLSKNQGWLFPILLFFTGFDLLLDSIVSVLNKNSAVKHRVLEFGLMIIRQTVPFVLFWFATGSFFLAVELWVIMMCSFGFAMGASFAVNHKGMPLVPEGSKIGYFERQVYTSRNIRSNWFTDNFMGGLNFQVEHHLFPSMPRPHLRQANEIVKEFCHTKGITLVETTWPEGFGLVVEHLNKVGISQNRSPFECPMVETYRK